MSDTQIIIALAVGASAFVIFCCLVLVMIVRLRRVMKTQLEAVDSLLSALRAGRGRDTPHEPS